MFLFNNKRTKLLAQPARAPWAKAAARRRIADRVNQIVENLIYAGFSVIVLRNLVLYVLAAHPVASVGDILAFDSSNSLSWREGIAVPARHIAGPWASPGATCELDIPSVASQDVALTVTALRPDGIILSLAGAAPAPSEADCGSDTPILISNGSYIRLLGAVTPNVMR